MVHRVGRPCCCCLVSPGLSLWWSLRAPGRPGLQASAALIFGRAASAQTPGQRCVTGWWRTAVKRATVCASNRPASVSLATQWAPPRHRR